MAALCMRIWTGAKAMREWETRALGLGRGLGEAWATGAVERGVGLIQGAVEVCHL